MSVNHTLIASLSLYEFYVFLKRFHFLLTFILIFQSLLSTWLGARSETSREATVRSNLVGNAGSRPISEAKQPWACPVLGWGTTGEAHVLYSSLMSSPFSISGWDSSEVRTSEAGPGHLALGSKKGLGQNRAQVPVIVSLCPTYHVWGSGGWVCR